MTYGDVVSDDLYRQIILDHYQNPRGLGHLECATHRQEGTNPSCGDTLELELNVKNGVVEDARFEGSGCSISMASASMLCEAIKGKSLTEALAVAHAFKARLLGKTAPNEADEEVDIGDLEALDGVKAYPVRIKCALLSWDTLLQAVGDEHASAS